MMYSVRLASSLLTHTAETAISQQQRMPKQQSYMSNLCIHRTAKLEHVIEQGLVLPCHFMRYWTFLPGGGDHVKKQNPGRKYSRWLAGQGPEPWSSLSRWHFKLHKL